MPTILCLDFKRNNITWSLLPSFSMPANYYTCYVQYLSYFQVFIIINNVVIDTWLFSGIKLYVTFFLLVKLIHIHCRKM